MQKSLKGIFAPICTPFDERGNILFDHLAKNVQKYAKTGLHGYLVLGSNGENKSLTGSEKEKVLETVIEYRDPVQTIMVGSIFESTAETIDFALMAQEAGADYITLLPPSYFKSAMKDSVLLKYFTDTASSLKIPCLLYKAPQFSGGVDLSVSLIKECIKHPNIAGIKDSSSSGIEKILSVAPKDFAVLSGSANTFFPAMMSGAVGGVLSIANYLPDKAVELYEYIRSGDLQKAVKLDRMIVTSNIEISGTYGVAGVKCAMDLCGYQGGYPRLPLQPIPPEGLELIRNNLVSLR
jgi:4-hydroxy-2-oxoglutarate aldolase